MQKMYYFNCVYKAPKHTFFKLLIALWFWKDNKIGDVIKTNILPRNHGEMLAT